MAIHVCETQYGGQKSAAQGIDLEFNRDEVKYLVSIKSGPNWGNSAQIGKLVDHFKTAKKILGTNAGKQHVVAINGCCYGYDSNPDKSDYLKLCGQDFWSLISGHDSMYVDLIEPIELEGPERTEKFEEEYAKVINKFTREFSNEYCDNDGQIQWEKLIKFNSGSRSK